MLIQILYLYPQNSVDFNPGIFLIVFFSLIFPDEPQTLSGHFSPNLYDGFQFSAGFS